MKNAKKLLALLMAVLMCVGVFAACGQQAAPAATEAPAAEEPAEEPAEAPAEEAAEEPAEEAAEEPAEEAAEEAAEEEAAEEAPAASNAETPLVVGYSPFNSKFSPFFSETAYDQDAYAMTQLGLLPSDRTGAIVLKGIEGETIEYNGTPYTYYGPADLTITENEDGTVYYDFQLRDDLVFSDGEPLTVDDIIFSMYVLCDPTYDGNSTLFAQPIEGMEAYRSGMDTLLNLIFNAGKDNEDFTFWTEEQQTAFWDKYDSATTALAEEIVNYCVTAGYNEEGDIAGAAANWGFGIEDNTIEAFAAALSEAYGADVNNMISTENAGSSTEDLFPGLEEYSTVGVETGESAPNITGIQKTGDYTMRVVATKVDATLIYQLATAIAPLHYYGDKAQYDYDNNQFGFPKGDLSMVRAKTTELNGLFTCEAVIDMGAAAGSKYTDLSAAKATLGVIDEHCILLWPMLKVGDYKMAYSAIWAAMTSRCDTDHGDVPYKSPSNELLGVSAAILADGTEVLLDINQAELVNSYGIVTAINNQGWKSWGNNTSIYPSSTDPKDRWIACRRMMSWYRNHFILTYHDKVDDPASYRLTEAFVDSENMYLNSLTASGAIAGGVIEFNEEENPITEILDGNIVFYTRIAFWTPAKYILNKIEFDPTILSAALGGE